MKLININKVDAILNTKKAINNLLKEAKIANLYKISQFAISRSNKYFLVAKSNPNAKSIIKSINQAIEAIKSTGKYYQLINNNHI